MKNLLLRLGAISLASCLAASAQALTLSEAFRAALLHDPQFLAAGFDRDAAAEGLKMAQAARYPQANLSASRSSVTGSREFDNSSNQRLRLPLDYQSPQTSLQIRVPIINDEIHARVGMAQAQSDASQMLLRWRESELADRLGTAYLTALLAREDSALAGAMTRQAEQQLLRSQRRHSRGEGTQVEIVQSEASLRLAQAKERDAADKLEIALRELRRITGLPVTVISASLQGFEPLPVQPASLSEWIQASLQTNAAIEVRRLQVEASDLNIRRSQAGHLPRLEAYANVSKSSNESLSSLNQESFTRQVGVQLTVPLFSGGGVQAGVRQARAERSRAEEELRALTHSVESDVQRFFLAVEGGVQRIQAQTLAVRAMEVAAHAARRSMEQGVGSVAQILEAESRLHQSQRELSQVRQEYLLARLRLLAQSGWPAQRVIEDLDGQLSAAVSTSKVRP